MNARDLYERGAATLLASFEVYADASEDAAVVRLPGVAAAVFPHEPERAVYNNALLERDLPSPAARALALDSAEEAYAAAGVTHFALWVHEHDDSMRADLERRDHLTLDIMTLDMGMSLDDMRVPRPTLDLGAPDWDEYLRAFDLPPGLLRHADHSLHHLRMAREEGKPVAAALAFDHEGDCGIYNVGTVEHARRRGLGTAITALQLHEARDRGCTTASVQSTEIAEGVYAAVGFRSLGRFLEYVPARD